MQSRNEKNITKTLLATVKGKLRRHRTECRKEGNIKIDLKERKYD
jgi:hypothetical protein